MKKQNGYYSEYIKINGIEQYLLHYSADAGNDVLLFLHGGPGSAESTFGYAFQKELSDLYTVVHYDQRGAGKTLTRNGKINDPSVDELIDDLFEIVQYLKRNITKRRLLF
jgi:pimeloyl-ACP methyl ester carboxylesterase